MDQLKKQFAIVAQYGFWIGTAVVLLGSLGIWYTTTSELDQENTSQISSIKSNAGQIQQLRGQLPEQPNEISHSEMGKKIDVRKAEVLGAWNSIYSKQRDILVWPDIQDEFVTEFSLARDEETGQILPDQQKLPFENYCDFPTPPDQEAAPRLRVIYERYIGRILPSIAEIVGAEWTAEFGKSDIMSNANELTPKEEPSALHEGNVVTWNTASQQSILSDLFPWNGRRPSTLEVYYSQENLWILKQLLEIVKTVNGDAQQPFEAKIREIKRLSIGKSAKFGAGNIDSPGVEGRSMGGMGMDYDMDMESGMDMGMDTMGMGGMSATLDPGDNRYLDVLNQPITGQALRSALTSKTPADAPLAVAKRVPVVMAVQIDQRYVHELLAACGSAPLMVEVKQCRILPKSAQTQATGGSGGGGGGGMGGMMEDYGEEDMGMEMDMGMGNSRGGVPSVNQKPEEEFPLDMQIEIYGLIFLYNPPDEEALGIEQVTEDTVIAGEKLSGEKVAAPDADLPAPTANTPAANTPAANTPAGGTDGPAVEPGTAAPDAANPLPGNPQPGNPQPTVPQPAAPGPPAADPSGTPSPAAVAPPTAIVPTTQPN